MKNLVLAFLITWLLAACSTSGPKFTPAPTAENDDALIYFMRSHVGYLGGYWTNFYIDDEEIVELFDEGYTWVHLKPGFYNFSAGFIIRPNLDFEIYIEPNRTYYIEYTQESAGYNQVRNKFHVLLSESESINLSSSQSGPSFIRDYSYKKANILKLDKN